MELLVASWKSSLRVLSWMLQDEWVLKLTPNPLKIIVLELLVLELY